jgi:transketolase C-terminal domain/subunit
LFAYFAGIGLIAVSYAIAWINVVENHAIMGGLVDEVQRIHQQRGLAEINGIGERNGGD